MKKAFYLSFLFILILFSCKDDDNINDPFDDSDLTSIPYDPQPYDLVAPSTLGQMEIPVDNPLLVDGVQLGRHLFYDPILSADSTMSCSSCHLPIGSFTDNLAVSKGVDGIAGTRSSMSLLNVGFFESGLFWDGRVNTLEEQALLPVEDPVELHATWPDVIDKLKMHDNYPSLFRKAFGIENKSEITKELAAKALAQFERIMVSSGKSRFDIVEAGTPGEYYSEKEGAGRRLFRFESGSVDHPGCDHCHNGPLLTNHTYENNGIQQAASLEDFPDKGRGAVTGLLMDNGRFRVPSLRNIELTAPYMHDGSLNTLEEVIDHYSTGGHKADNFATFFKPFTITALQKDSLIAFLKTFTDIDFVNNPDLQNPF